MTSALNTTIDQRLRTARIAKGYATAKKFAEQHHIPYATYIAHESGKISLSSKAAQKYANMLDIPLEWLLNGEVREIAAENQRHTIHAKRKIFERIVLPKVVESILTILNKKDSDLDIEALMHKAFIITSEVLSKAQTLDDVDPYINSIVVLSEHNLRRSIIEKK